VLLGKVTGVTDADKTDYDSSLYLLQKVSLDFLIHLSIVPSAVNLARFKVHGHLPQLHINFSDEKYKALMGIIDAAIPNFGIQETQIQKISEQSTRSKDTMKLQGNFFSEFDSDYLVTENSKGQVTSTQNNEQSVSFKPTSIHL
jgi:vacuolar protein sorting-associated protein 13A/C